MSVVLICILHNTEASSVIYKSATTRFVVNVTSVSGMIDLKAAVGYNIFATSIPENSFVLKNVLIKDIKQGKYEAKIDNNVTTK